MSHPSFRAHRAVLGALLGLAPGCSAATTAPSADASDRQAAFNPIITPTAVSLAPGATQAFTASSSEKASWTASGGTIDATGFFTAPATAGTYRVIARWPAHQRSDTSIVTVTVTTPPPPPPPPAPTLTSMSIVPDSIWMTQKDTFALAVYGRTSAGDSVTPAVTWSATGGTIDASGQYVAGIIPGIYAITARSANGLVATAAVKVDWNNVKLLVSPKTVSVTAGQTQQFTAKGVAITNDTVAVSVIWHATGGTITSTGLFTAATTAGTYSVWCELAAPTWGGSPVLFTRQSGLSGRVVRMPLTGSAALQIGN
jgi:plastocyanin